jgi:predicted acyl esterase
MTNFSGSIWLLVATVLTTSVAMSQAQPAPLTPGQVERYTWKLPDVNHVFLPGHRIMVQVQSTLFPLYDRNPQTYVANIMYASPGDCARAPQTIWYGGNSASAIHLPLVP